MWYKEYYKLTQFDPTVYGSTNTKYRVYRKTQTRNKKTTKKKTQKTDRLVNGAMLAFQCLVYNTIKIADPF